MDPLQFGTRLHAELFDQEAPCPREAPQRLGLPARAVQGDHVLRPEPLPERELTGQRLQLLDQALVRPHGEVGFNPPLESGQAQLLQPLDLRLQTRGISEIGVGLSTPQPECIAQLRGGRVGFIGQRLAACRDEPFEATESTRSAAAVRRFP